ncbi:hypothetical protein [Fundidesulfovibrio soli]|uniref:hypothetical protein n=1 Tax=Fundidesulfovibrio soli TaxID=2922716 RepID=UPI001FAEDDCA|nr:hypothetical protein [Fundidesulfovibrio soli]
METMHASATSSPASARATSREARGLDCSLALAASALGAGRAGGEAPLRRLHAALAQRAEQADHARLLAGLLLLDAGLTDQAGDVFDELLRTPRAQAAVIAQLRPRLEALLRVPCANFSPSLRALLAQLCFQAGRPGAARACLEGMTPSHWRRAGLGAPLAELCQSLVAHGCLAEGAALLKGLSGRDLAAATPQLRLLLGELAWELGARTRTRARASARLHFSGAAGPGVESDPFALSRVVCGLMACSRPGLAEAVTERARAALPDISPRTLPMALSLAEALAFAGRAREARGVLAGLDMAWLAGSGPRGGGLTHWAATVCLRAQDWAMAGAICRAYVLPKAALGHADLNLLWNVAALEGQREDFLDAVRDRADRQALGPDLAAFWEAEALALLGRFDEALEPLRRAERGGLILLGRVPLLLGTALACSGQAELGADALLAAQAAHFTNNLRVAWGWAAGLEAALALLHLGRADNARQALAAAVRAYPGPGNPCRALLRHLSPGPLPAGFSRRCLAGAEACPSAMNAGHLGRAWHLLLAALSHRSSNPSPAAGLLRACPGLIFPDGGEAAQLPAPEAVARAFYPYDPAGSPRLAVLESLAAGERF